MKTAVSTMKFLVSLKLSLSKVRNKQAILLQAQHCYGRELTRRGPNNDLSQTLSMLKDFREAEDPFPSPLNDEFATLCEHQRSILKELDNKKKEIRERSCSTKKWKRAWKVLHNAAFVSVLVLSVVIAALSGPPVAAVAVGAGCTASKTAGQWIDSVWAHRIGLLDDEKNILSAMMEGEVLARELESVRAMVRRLGMRIRSVEGDAGFAVDREGEEIAVETAMEEIKGRLDGIEEWISRVEMKVEDFGGEIKKVTAQVLDCYYK